MEFEKLSHFVNLVGFQLLCQQVLSRIVEPLYLGISINYLFSFIKEAKLLVDYNATVTFSDNANKLTTELQKESEKAIGWFCSNKLVFNPDKFQSVVFNRIEKLNDS